MTKEQIEAVFERVKDWPAEKQELAISVLMSIDAHGDDGHEMTPELEAELDQAIAEADGGEFVSDEEMKAFFARHR